MPPSLKTFFICLLSLATYTPITIAAPISVPTSAPSFNHPGLLHTQADLQRMRQQIAAARQPWEDGWKILLSNPHAQLTWIAHPAQVVVRGAVSGKTENYPTLYNDIAAAYACGLRWQITGDTRYADKAVEILNAWSTTLKTIDGNSDRFLAAGIYGYEIANAGEILRDFSGWKPQDFHRFQNLMLTVFYPMNHDFLLHHNGAKIDHYWCNWDACNMASQLSIGVLCDRRDLYDNAIEYFKHGPGNGSIEHAVIKLYPGGLGQWQESGRDQGHCTLGIALMGAFCQMAHNQGDDLFAYDNNRFLAGAEYVAKYNLGYHVPYTSYSNSDLTQPVISASSRGDIRPCWELLYNHYVNIAHLPAPYIQMFAEKTRPEGGGGDYGPKSGGYDQLGYGTLTFTIDPSNAR